MYNTTKLVARFSDHRNRCNFKLRKMPGPSARGRASEETSKAGSRRTSSESSKKLNGWADVARKQEERARREEEGGKEFTPMFWMKSGETAHIQFLDDEPYTFDAHNIKDAKGKWDTTPCQLAKQKYCLCCREGIKQTWKAAFRVLDYRGSWDKDMAPKKRGGDKGGFTWDEPVEKLWVVNLTILGQLEVIRTKKKKELSQMVLDVSRTGSGKSDTSYMFEQAYELDDEDVKRIPIDHEPELETPAFLCAPLSDEALIEKGFEAPDEK